MAALEQRYALALDRIVAEGKADAATLQRELLEITATLAASPALLSVLASPAVSWTQKRSVLDALGARMQLSQIARNFLAVTVHRGRATHLSGMEQAFEALRLEREGIVKSEVVSARALDPGERTALETALGREVGRRLQARYRLDAALLGGFRARVGDRVYDGSLSGRLARLRQTLLEA